MNDSCINSSKLETSGFAYTMSLISGKYKMSILYALMNYRVVRFNELHRYLGGITFKTLSSALKQLAADGLVRRQVCSQLPPRVEYSLTEKGASLIPILDELCTWGETNRPPAPATEEHPTA